MIGEASDWTSLSTFLKEVQDFAWIQNLPQTKKQNHYIIGIKVLIAKMVFDTITITHPGVDHIWPNNTFPFYVKFGCPYLYSL